MTREELEAEIERFIGGISSFSAAKKPCPYSLLDLTQKAIAIIAAQVTLLADREWRLELVREALTEAEDSPRDMPSQVVFAQWHADITRPLEKAP